MVKKIEGGFILVCIFLIVFLFVHSDLLLFNKYRTTHDTFASYSEFYYALNSLRNSTLPLWDPYTHGGQPFYYHFVKIPGGEFSVIFFSLISYLSNISIMTLYHFQITIHFLIFVFGCFYLARILFQRKLISYYILLLGLFGSQFGSIVGQPGVFIIIEFLPWLMAFFILFVSGKAHSYHLFASIITFLFYIQTAADFLISFYFLLLFCILYCVFFRRQLSLPKIHWAVWVLAAFILCLGLTKTFVLFSETDNLFPSLRAFNNPYPPRIVNGLNIASPLDQVAPAYMVDYLNLLNPFFERCATSSELKFYLGFIPAFFAFYAIFVSRNKFIWTLLIPGILSLWISLGPTAFLSSLCFYVLPLFKSIRVMEHFSLAPVYVGFVFISAFGFEGILEKAVALKNLSSFWSYFRKYLWFFIISAIAIAIIYNKGFNKSLLVLLYYFIPIIVILLFELMNRNLQGFLARDGLIKCTMALISAFLVVIMALFSFGRVFIGEIFLDMHRLILISISFCFMLGYIILHLNRLDRKRLSIIVVFCLGITFIELLFITSFSAYLRMGSRVDAIVPERVKSFEYQNYRLESYWPAKFKNVHFLRAPMLYLQSSVITKKPSYYDNIPVVKEYGECDFYMLKKFWEAYQRFPEGIKKVVMAIDMPKLAFFTDYKVMDDEAVFKESKNLNPQLLKHYIYLAPDNYEVPSFHKIPKRQASSEDIEVEHFDNNRLKLSIDAKEEGLLYYSDGYDKNWKCFVDGKEQPIYRANVAFKAVSIPEGRHTVLFVYRPTFYLISLWLFLIACAIGFVSLCWSWARRKRSDD